MYYDLCLVCKANNLSIIVALDFSDTKEALQFVEKLQPNLCRLKVGKALFTKAGPTFVEQLIGKGFDIFLDLKFHDIPHTVAKACAVAADLGVWMLNMHASGGADMMSLAREMLDKGGHRPLLIGVTVLTSMDAEIFRKLGMQCSIEEQVMRLSQLSYDAGCDGVVCSAHEVKKLREHFGKKFQLVTPGIRIKGSDSHDQKRIMSPRQAMQLGSDHLVIGRSITQSPNPAKVIEDIVKELNITTE